MLQVLLYGLPGIYAGGHNRVATAGTYNYSYNYQVQYNNAATTITTTTATATTNYNQQQQIEELNEKQQQPTDYYLFDYKFFVYPKIVRYLYPLSTTVQMATVYLTLTVTMERYVAVCLPLKARSLCTTSRARYAILIISIISIIYNLPRFWEVKLRQQWHAEANLTVNCIVGTTLRRNKLYIALYVHWMYFFVYYAFPFAALLIFNVAIYNNVSSLTLISICNTTPRPPPQTYFKRHLKVGQYVHCVACCTY